MNSKTTNSIIRFIVLVLAQVIVLNHIDFLGYINPYLYIFFIIIYPVKNNRLIFLFLSFLLGLAIDIFSDSGGVHAAACVSIAYIRPVVLKFSFGTLYDHQTIKFNNMGFLSLLGYVSLLTLIHHFILFSLEIFNVSKIVLTLQKTLFASIFTILLCILIIFLFNKKGK